MWKGLRFDAPLEYSCLADEIALQLSPVDALDSLVRFAAFGTIVIAALGLFALASYIGISWLLEQVPYHVNVNIWLFLAGSTFLILLSIIVVGMKSLKAATSNPAESLRYE